MEHSSSENIFPPDQCLPQEPSLSQLGVLEHQGGSIEPRAGVEQALAPPPLVSQIVTGVQTQQSQEPVLAVAAQDVEFPVQTSNIRGRKGSHAGTRMFSAANVELPTTYEGATYRDTLNQLNSLWSEKTREIENISDEHWRSPEFPLARIKKIMRMDEDVKMISTEVPIMFSKILEIFISELTMRSWLHTVDSKRRTVQRSDIAMAITKNDMFDFLIDIVPREEIQLKTKAHNKEVGAGLGENLQLLPPDMLQLYIQQVINQTLSSMAANEEGGGEGGEDSSALTLQQLQLLQQLIQLQQEQQQQQQGDVLQQDNVMEQLQHVTETPSSAVGAGSQYHTAGMDVQVLHSSVTTPQAAMPDSSSVATTLEQLSSNATMALGSNSSAVALEPLGANSSNNNTDNSVYHGQQQAFSQVESSHHLHDTRSSLSQQQPSTSSLFTSREPHITTVVIPPPLDSALQPHSPVILPSSILDTLQSENSQDQNLRRQLESLATEHFVSHQLPVPVELSSTLPSGNSGANMSATTVRPEEEFQSIPDVSEGESVDVSSPIPDVTSGTDMVFSTQNF